MSAAKISAVVRAAVTVEFTVGSWGGGDMSDIEEPKRLADAPTDRGPELAP